MKKLKFWDSLKPWEPENEWEAKYIIEYNKLNLFIMLGAAGILLVTLFIASAALAFVSNYTQCEFEIDGAIEGNFEFNQDLLSEEVLLFWIFIFFSFLFTRN